MKKNIINEHKVDFFVSYTKNTKDEVVEKFIKYINMFLKLIRKK
jgi:hypothetical protein